ncbi:hypothetical protein FWF89_01370 [Candidatus Saccharibacteria bacterium]|nr:hypothetical protein [Candidatus Saccharibacteria bacterium]
MERERSAMGAQKILSGVFALVIAGIVIVLVVFVARRVGEINDVCAAGVHGMDITDVCGEEEE